MRVTDLAVATASTDLTRLVEFEVSGHYGSWGGNTRRRHVVFILGYLSHCDTIFAIAQET
jgi:hypothetical protein